jgi:hypothetical protein
MHIPCLGESITTRRHQVLRAAPVMLLLRPANLQQVPVLIAEAKRDAEGSRACTINRSQRRVTAARFRLTRASSLAVHPSHSRFGCEAGEGLAGHDTSMNAAATS